MTLLFSSVNEHIETRTHLGDSVVIVLLFLLILPFLGLMRRVMISASISLLCKEASPWWLCSSVLGAPTPGLCIIWLTTSACVQGLAVRGLVLSLPCCPLSVLPGCACILCPGWTSDLMMNVVEGDLTTCPLMWRRVHHYFWTFAEVSLFLQP